MVEFKLDIKGLDRIDNLPREFLEGLRNGIKRAALYGESKVKQDFTQYLKVRTGTLRRSVDHRVDRLRIEIFSDVEYAGIQEHGGTVEGKPYLRFKGDGGWVAVEQVKVPASGFLSKPIDQNMSNIRKIIQDDIIKEMNKP